jgi:hypothetical protein
MGWGGDVRGILNRRREGKTEDSEKGFGGISSKSS